MRTAARRSGTTAALALLGTAVCALASSAGAAPQAVDIHIDVVVGSSPTTGRPVPNGGTATVTGLRFAAGLDVSLITALPASARVRLTLPDGLTWGADLLRWELEPIPGGTRLTLRHTLEDRSWAAKVVAGWHICLDVAERFLAGRPIGRIVGDDARRYGWERLHNLYAERLGLERSG